MQCLRKMELETGAHESFEYFTAGIRKEQCRYLLQCWSPRNKLNIFMLVTSVFELYIHLRYSNADLAT